MDSAGGADMGQEAGVMAQIEAIVNTVNGIVWGPAMLVLILGTITYEIIYINQRVNVV
jgi:hypothetical protein